MSGGRGPLPKEGLNADGLSSSDSQSRRRIGKKKRKKTKKSRMNGIATPPSTRRQDPKKVEDAAAGLKKDLERNARTKAIRQSNKLEVLHSSKRAAATKERLDRIAKDCRTLIARHRQSSKTGKAIVRVELEARYAVLLGAIEETARVGSNHPAAAVAIASLTDAQAIALQVSRVLRASSAERVRRRDKPR
jgi:hypothetical protein